MKTSWVGKLAVVAAAVMLSVAAVERAEADAIDSFVSRFYQDVLERAPDGEGLAGWNSYLRLHCSAQGFSTLAQGFFGSPEFVTTRRLTIEQLVARFYRTFLGREADAAGLAGWADAFRQVRLAMALNGFVPSREFQGLLPDRTDRAAVAGLVSRLYAEILQRAPDETGLNGWVDAVVASRDLRALAHGFLASPEFESRALTFPEFVTILYRTFLGREPDPPGLEGWVSVLREAMLQILGAGFIPSSEFQGLSALLCPTGTAMPSEPQLRLNIRILGGAGQVTGGAIGASNDIACDHLGGQCSATVPVGATVQLLAVPETALGTMLNEWASGPCSANWLSSLCIFVADWRNVTNGADQITVYYIFFRPDFVGRYQSSYQGTHMRGPASGDMLLDISPDCCSATLLGSAWALGLAPQARVSVGTPLIGPDVATLQLGGSGGSTAPLAPETCRFRGSISYAQGDLFYRAGGTYECSGSIAGSGTWHAIRSRESGVRVPGPAALTAP